MTGMNMDPDLWGNLPTELLQLVFSRLSVVDICKLQLLSKTWKQAIDSMDSCFSQLLERTTYPSMLGVISSNSEGQFCGRVVDVKAGQQHAYAFGVDPSENYVTTMGAADGGLVCFVSRGSMRPRFIVVMNPLTGKKIELPGLLTMDGHVVLNIMPLMVQLTMDRQTWQYKVLVVGYMDGATGKRLFVQVYDSKIKGWMVVGSEQQIWDRIFGYSYHSWIHSDTRLNYLALLGPCMYDFAAGLYYFDNTGGLTLVSFDFKDIIAYAVLKNHLFVLKIYSDLSSGVPFYNYYISEFVLEKNATAWVEVGRINDLPFDESSGFMYSNYQSFFLDACKGFLMLSVDHKVRYIYDLSGCYWLELPPIQRRPALCRSYGPLDLLCELRWNATP